MLFDPPERVEVIATTPDGPVRRVYWRGETLDICHSIGPERITGEWWRMRQPPAILPSQTTSRDPHILPAEHEPGQRHGKMNRIAAVNTTQHQHQGAADGTPGIFAAVPPCPSLAYRDYFLVVTAEQGRWLWVFRASSCNAWFVQGEWA